ncbi:MAG: hypothetical protein ABSC36_00310 [Gaiellaceae bacterium]
MSRAEPRKRVLSDILEDGARLVFRHIVVFLRLTAPLILPVTAALIGVVTWRASSSGSSYLATAILVAIGVVYAFAVMLCASACVAVAAEASRGAEPSARAAIELVLGRIGQVLCLATLLVVAAAPTIALPVLPTVKALGHYAPLSLFLALISLWLVGKWSVALPAMLEEKIGTVDSLRRSAELVRGSFLRALGTVVLGGVFSLFAGAVVAIIVSVFSFGGGRMVAIVSLIGFALGELFVAPFFAGFLVVLYRDLLEREQGSSPVRTSRRVKRSTKR